jgi:hypothetical protein
MRNLHHSEEEIDNFMVPEVYYLDFFGKEDPLMIAE